MPALSLKVLVLGNQIEDKDKRTTALRVQKCLEVAEVLGRVPVRVFIPQNSPAGILVAAEMIRLGDQFPEVVSIRARDAGLRKPKIIRLPQLQKSVRVHPAPMDGDGWLTAFVMEQEIDAVVLVGEGGYAETAAAISTNLLVPAAGGEFESELRDFVSTRANARTRIIPREAVHPEAIEEALNGELETKLKRMGAFGA